MEQSLAPRSSVRGWLRRQRRRFQCSPPLGWIRFGSLQRTQPISRVFGFDRGQCIDRYYIERFLRAHVADIKGRVLEAGDDGYTRLGGPAVTASDVLHADGTNPQATIVADLARPGSLPADAFDCIILTQTLNFIYDMRAALRSAYSALRPGGVLLVTVPGISQISRYDMDRWGDYWRMTTKAARCLFEEVFPSRTLTVVAHGNVFAAVAFLHGLAVEDVRRDQLDLLDRDYELVLTIRAVKPETRG